MKIPKYQAVELLNEKISVFEGILNEVSDYNLYDEDYKIVIAETETLLTKLFSYDEVLNFRKYTTNTTFNLNSHCTDENGDIIAYKEHLKRCIRKLKVCVENFYDFPAGTEIEYGNEGNPSIFLSPSFETRCNDIQVHLLEILKTLQLSYFTTQAYHNVAVPPDIEKVISETDVFICIAGKRGVPWNYSTNTNSELRKELEWAKRLNKKIIVWLEEGVKEYNELLVTADVVSFKSGDISSLRQATINFLEILKKYSII